MEKAVLRWCRKNRPDLISQIQQVLSGHTYPDSTFLQTIYSFMPISFEAGLERSSCE